MSKKLIYYIDIDNTICTPVENAEYTKAKPYLDRIEEYNKLYKEGHVVVYWTARGSTTGIDWTELTKKQLGKPYYDVFIDDKSINPNK